MIKAIRVTPKTKDQIAQEMGVSVDDLDAWWPGFINKYTRKPTRSYFVKNTELATDSWKICTRSGFNQLFEFINPEDAENEFVEIKGRK